MANAQFKIFVSYAEILLTNEIPSPLIFRPDELQLCRPDEIFHIHTSLDMISQCNFNFVGMKYHDGTTYYNSSVWNIASGWDLISL